VNFIAGSESVSRGVSGSGVTGGPTAPPSSPTAPPAEAGSPSVTQLVADADGVTFAIAWAPAAGAASYGYVAAFNDGSATQQGTVTAPSLQLRMPYYASGAASGGFVCIRSIGATGLQSIDQSCAGLSIPARPGSSVPPPAPPPPSSPVSVPARPGAPPPPPPPPPPGPPPTEYGWGVG
jgi:hypothetical protein